MAAAFLAGAFAATFLAAGFFAATFFAGAFLATGLFDLLLLEGFLGAAVFVADFFAVTLVLALDFLVAIASYLITELFIEAVYTPQKGLRVGGFYSTLLQRGREATRLVTFMPLNLPSLLVAQLKNR